MKNLTIIFALLFQPLFSGAQNFQCVQANATHFFINDNAYLRGIRIDSSKMTSNNLVLFPFRSPRGKDYNTSTPLDTNGGSWLGKKIIVLPDGTNMFDNMWGDTLIIKTQAQPGDSWIFYNDTTAVYFEAQVTSADTMTISGSVDSIKTIKLTAKNGTAIATTEPANNAELILSKNNGFVRTIDLFVFPYHKPNIPYYQSGNDYFLDKANGFNFHLINIPNVTSWEVYNLAPGDIFYNMGMGQGPQYVIDSIVSKTTTNNTAIFSIKGTDIMYNYATSQWVPSVYTNQLTIQDRLFLDTLFMPEQTGFSQFIHYYPNDTTLCSTGPVYWFSDNFIWGTQVNTFEPCGIATGYKKGLGRIGYSICYDPTPGAQYSLTLKGAYKNGIPCGWKLNLGVNATLSTNNKVNIYPNPASEAIFINMDTPGKKSITLYSMSGGVLQTISTEKAIEEINVLSMPAGLHLLTVQTEDGRRIFYKIEILH